MRDRNAVAVVKADGTVVGHIPYNIAPILSPFLMREFNEGKMEITKYINRVKELLSALEENGILPSP